METSQFDPSTDDSVASGRLVTLLALGALAYVVIGAFWMDAHNTGPTSTLTLTSVVQYLWAIASWPLDLIGVI